MTTKENGWSKLPTSPAADLQKGHGFNPVALFRMKRKPEASGYVRENAGPWPCAQT